MQDRNGQHGAVLFGLAGGMLVVAGALAGGYYVVATRSEARAATRPDTSVKSEHADARATAPVAAKSSAALDAYLAKTVELKTGSGVAKLTWGELGVEIDP